MKDVFKLVLITAIAFASVDSQAFLGFGGGEKARALKEADAALADANEAGKQGRALDEITALYDARTLYIKVDENHPGYKSEYVQERFEYTIARLRTLTAQINSGQVSLPDADTITKGGGKGFVSVNTTNSGNAEPVAPPPAAAAPTPAAPPAPPPPAKPADIRSGAATTIPASASAMFALAAQTAAPAVVVGEAARARVIEDLIDNDNAADAVLTAEDFIEQDGANASVTTRLLLVRALMEVRNYRRASAELAKLFAEVSAPTPAMRSFSAALEFQKGNYTEAMFQMDMLVTAHPDYADAYINMAYLYYMLNPTDNANIAVMSYRKAISSGAKRDVSLEKALKITVEHAEAR